MAETNYVRQTLANIIDTSTGGALKVRDVEALYVNGGGLKTFTTSPSTVTANYKAIYMCRNSQFTSIIATGDILKATRISSKTSFAAGTVIQGTITKIKLKGGAVFCIS